MPRSETEIITAFEQARGQACEQTPTGEPLELKSFALNFDGAAIKTTDGKRPGTPGGSSSRGSSLPGSSSKSSDSKSSSSRTHSASAARKSSLAQSYRELPTPTARRTAFTLGLDVSRADQAKLPLGSAGLIMDYIHDHYVAVQVSVHRDLVDDAIYLGSRPLAAMANFRGARTTQDFVETTASSVNNIRGIGLWLRSKDQPTPANLRTAIFVHKDLTAVERGSQLDARPSYELVFVRARPRESRESGGVELHAFVTSEQRQRLNYLRFTPWPSGPDECSVKGSVVFTEYRFAQRIPSASATRSFVLRARDRFTFAQLDALAHKNRWTGDALDNLTDTLDAIIDGKIEK